MGQMLYHLKKFPPYVHQDYPKHIRLGENEAIAIDAEHEAALMRIWANKLVGEAHPKRGPGRPRKS